MCPQHLVRSEAPRRIQRRGDELQPFQLRQIRTARLLTEHGIAQARSQPFERRRLEKEQLHVVGEPVEHVVGEEVPVGSAPASHVGDRGSSFTRTERRRGEMEQLQGGNPPGALAFELGDFVGEQRSPVQLAEELVDLPGPEAKVVRTDLAHGTSQAKTGHVESRTLAGEGDEVDRRAEVGQELADCRLALGPDQSVELVDHEELLARSRSPARHGRTTRRGRATRIAARRAVRRPGPDVRRARSPARPPDGRGTTRLRGHSVAPDVSPLWSFPIRQDRQPS